MARKRKSDPGPFLLHLPLLRDRIAKPDRFAETLPSIRHLN
jgi:hypothetical protein